MNYLMIFEEFNNAVFSQLIGNMVTALFISKDEDDLIFEISSEDNGKKYLKYYTEGDCCNSVWFTSVNGIDDLVGYIVEYVDDKGWSSVSDDNFRKNDDCEESIMWTIKTNLGGYCDIEVRNSHNGYYGGRVNFAGEFDKSDIKWEEFKEIKSDF